MTVRFKRRKVRDNVKDIYPQPSGGRRGRTGRPIRGEKVPSEDNEPRAISCYQCGQPLEDYRQNDKCPFCGSNNVRGKRL